MFLIVILLTQKMLTKIFKMIRPCRYNNFTVHVFDNSSSTSSTTFTLATDTTQTASDSECLLFTRKCDDGKFEVYFGDGIIGKALSDGNVVRSFICGY